MKIVYYCQHVLGMGHFFRSLEICKAFTGHDVILVSGGVPMDMPVPAHIRRFHLIPLSMDAEFSRLESDPSLGTVEAIQAARKAALYALFEKERPDVFLVELFPFGRKAFGFELIPVFDGIREKRLAPCRVVCSLRDVLVEKKDVAAYESRVVDALNRWFDALLIHADPSVIRLDETFSRMPDIRIPVVYTGFVTPRPDNNDRTAIRKELGVSDASPLILASAGGGKVGGPLLDAVIRAFPLLPRELNAFLQMFTGPFMEDGAADTLMQRATERIRISRFTPDFPAFLAAADLSVSMAGYNTCMNIAAARTPSLVWPFSQNREQRLRSERFSRMGGMGILEDADLEPGRLVSRIMQCLTDRTRPLYPMNLNGAVRTAEWIRTWTDPEGSAR